MANKCGIQYVSFYTAGSAARKITPVPQNVQPTLPKAKKKKKYVFYVDPVAILGIVVAVSMLVMMVVGLSVLHDEQMQTAQMQQYVDRLQAENDVLSDTFYKNFDPVEVERTALALGMKHQSQVPQTVIYIPAEPVEEAPAQTGTFLTYIGTIFSGLFA